MISAWLLSAVAIAFPRSDRNYPPVDRSYVIGSASRDNGTVTITSSAMAGEEKSGMTVKTYRTGAWATMVPLRPGENVIEAVAADGSRAEVKFFVESAPTGTVTAATNAAPAKVYEKLAYCADRPREKPMRTNATEFIVAVDPGHGGSDTGAISPHGGYEKDANLRIAKAVRAELLKRGFQVMMTREGDEKLELKERPHEAHRRGADVFISLHHNAPAMNCDAANTRYFSVYHWNELGERLAKDLERKMAETLLPEGIPSGGVMRRNFAVTRSTEIPSALVECDFISHPGGEERCCDQVSVGKLARAIAEAVENYLIGGKQ